MINVNVIISLSKIPKEFVSSVPKVYSNRLSSKSAKSAHNTANSALSLPIVKYVRQIFSSITLH